PTPQLHPRKAGEEMAGLVQIVLPDAGPARKDRCNGLRRRAWDRTWPVDVFRYQRHRPIDRLHFRSRRVAAVSDAEPHRGETDRSYATIIDLLKRWRDSGSPCWGHTA